MIPHATNPAKPGSLQVPRGVTNTASMAHFSFINQANSTTKKTAYAMLLPSSATITNPYRCRRPEPNGSRRRRK